MPYGIAGFIAGFTDATYRGNEFVLASRSAHGSEAA